MGTYFVRFRFDRISVVEWREAPPFSSVRQVVTWAFDQIPLLETLWPPAVEFSIYFLGHDAEVMSYVGFISTRPDEV